MNELNKTKTRVENNLFFLNKMTHVMQSMRCCLFECYKFNALLILLTLVLHERITVVFGITVNPLDSIISSSSTTFDSDEYRPSEFASEVHDLNKIDYSQFTSGYNKYVGSHEITDTGPYVFESTVGGVNQHSAMVKQPISENQSDSLSEFMKMFSIPLHHSVFEVPNFFNNRISVKSRYVTKAIPPLSPPPSFPVRQIVTRPAPSPITAITDGIKDRLKAIYPGTLWCGDGNQASNQNEIGLFRNTDICCKQHDECPAFIKSGGEFKGLRNTGLFTRTHCACDLKFYNCLKRTDTLISNKIGYTYFNILRPQCFRKEFPIVGCKKWINKKCVMYMVDGQNSPVWQWFENKLF
ncbi:uncharacterized protein LOC116344217 [Contarinia nasturtii]|uniref:uncharacterized protein LOC116344217 n=1 Tax=Contarinia nasturtii TaxID=265458 RepID=UPI0012D44AA1|nr:uncharacterized protein LOC116344217 [Contarinia nasturtii]XP_031628528.1 uncharacterized protein LOC116344217 [Contarinia nasturtii]XP_031628529.1 uncharacterized protein LOC116344217 [Contarinia nasturtii]